MRLRGYALLTQEQENVGKKTSVRKKRRTEGALTKTWPETHLAATKPTLETLYTWICDSCQNWTASKLMTGFMSVERTEILDRKLTAQF